MLVCASVLRSLPPAAPPASPVAPALAHARGMLGRVLYAAAFYLLLIYTMDSQPTDKVEGVGDNSAPLYICRVVLFLLRQRRGAGLVF